MIIIRRVVGKLGTFIVQQTKYGIYGTCQVHSGVMYGFAD